MAGNDMKSDALDFYAGDLSKLNIPYIRAEALKIVSFFENHWSYSTETLPELVLGYYLKYLFGDDFSKTRNLEWLKGVGGRKLELDLYNNELKIAAEFNGPQHYFIEYYMEVYGLDEITARKRFNDRNLNDLIKTRQCAENGIFLIVISSLDNPNLINWQELIINQYELWIGGQVSELRNKPMLSYEQVLELLSKEMYEDLKLKFFRTFGISYKF